MPITAHSLTRLGPFHFPWNNAATTFAMAALNAGWCARVRAWQTKDIKSVRLHWNSVATPGTVELRIETIDATSGKPSGSLYDASATKSFTPSAGWQHVAFDALPTAGLTVGTEYGIVLLTTAGGTTQTLSSHFTQSLPAALPTVTLTAADGTTRSNFTKGATTPVVVVVYEDDTEEALVLGSNAWNGNKQIFGTNRHGAKIVLASATKIRGIWGIFSTKSGTPSNLIGKILDSGNTIVSSFNYTLDLDSLSNIGAGRAVVIEADAITLAAGTYRVIWVQSDTTTTSGNRFNLFSATLPTGNLHGDYTHTTSTDESTWTDTTTDLPACGFLYDDGVVDAGGGGGPVIGGRVVR